MLAANLLNFHAATRCQNNSSEAAFNSVKFTEMKHMKSTVNFNHAELQKQLVFSDKRTQTLTVRCSSTSVDSCDQKLHQQSLPRGKKTTGDEFLHAKEQFSLSALLHVLSVLSPRNQDQRETKFITTLQKT